MNKQASRNLEASLLGMGLFQRSLGLDSVTKYRSVAIDGTIWVCKLRPFV